MPYSNISTVSLYNKLVVIFLFILSLDPEQPEVGTDPSLVTSLPPAGFSSTSSMAQENVELVQSDDEGEEAYVNYTDFLLPLMHVSMLSPKGGREPRAYVGHLTF